MDMIIFNADDIWFLKKYTDDGKILYINCVSNIIK